MSFLKKLFKKSAPPMPGGTAGKYGKSAKFMAALSGFGPAMLDKDVVGARGSAKMIGRSVDQAKDKTTLMATEEDTQQKAAAAAAAAAAEEPFNIAKESQRKGLLRKGRRASILTSSQGADPLGIPG